jgi:hypothetical protein
VLNVPAGTVEGDVMIAAIYTNAFTPGVPAGWTDPRGDRFLWYKRASGSEPANYTWTTGSIANWVGGIATYRGLDRRSLLGAYESSAGSAGGASPVPWTGYTFTRSGNLAVATAYIRSSDIVITGSLTGWTSRFQLVHAGLTFFVGLWDKFDNAIGLSPIPNTLSYNESFTGSNEGIVSGWYRAVNSQGVV